MTRVRYFAAAQEAAGVAEETVEAATRDLLVAELVARHGGGLARVLDRCALLADGRRLDAADDPVAPAAVVDVLPPFAGG
ncbi:MoaD/ThiS family protein [Actinotalea sp. M2MS4P-6]|uniref:MoaD/ThiS family protein n=1 Tax=Actinotalea sp. M2MS4P-6 TaxID=2983762 RepID=UPI0021E4B8C6|nr:MoaD/ThiS family protein [Actinotalea sp. M2MS4P-6]MCV2393782.1 MoaD/ThiS family protein [Actinotalea sp. M2MS4P-6]